MPVIRRGQSCGSPLALINPRFCVKETLSRITFAEKQTVLLGNDGRLCLFYRSESYRRNQISANERDIIGTSQKNKEQLSIIPELLSDSRPPKVNPIYLIYNGRKIVYFASCEVTEQSLFVYNSMCFFFVIMYPQIDPFHLQSAYHFKIQS